MAPRPVISLVIVLMGHWAGGAGALFGLRIGPRS
jgi:hypothetical protein